MLGEPSACITRETLAKYTAGASEVEANLKWIVIFDIFHLILYKALFNLET